LADGARGRRDVCELQCGRRAGGPHAAARSSRLRANLSDLSAILEAIVEWTRRYGDVPAMVDWDPARARRLEQDWRIARYRQGDWPSVRTVAHHFGSLLAAIEAAGLTPRARASQHADRRAERAANRHAVARLCAAGLTPGGSE